MLLRKVWEEGCKGETGTVRVSPANKKLFPNNTPPAARRARSNGESVGRQNDEIFIIFKSFMVNMYSAFVLIRVHLRPFAVKSGLKPVRRPALPGAFV